MANRAVLRAADADREHVAERLRRAGAEGRLLIEELEQRMERALRARTYGELDALIADLPGPRLLPRRSSRGLHPAVRYAIAVPVVLVALTVVLFVATGVLAGWMLWIAFGWWFFGHRRRRYRGGPPYAGGCWHRPRSHGSHSGY